MEIEVSEGESKANKTEKMKEKCVWSMKDLIRSLEGAQEEGYKLLASEHLSDEEKDQIVSVVATAKGSTKVIEKLLAEKSDVSEKTRETIDKKADNFLAGLEGETEDKFEEE